jgi:hypothetical protein
MINENEILKKILLHMRYDSSRTLSENKKFITEENTVSKQTTTVNIFGKQITFNGEVRTTVAQELSSGGFGSSEESVRPKSGPALVRKLCQSATQSYSTNDYKLSNCIKQLYPKLKTIINQKAPFRIKDGENLYNLSFSCGEWPESAITTDPRTGKRTVMTWDSHKWINGGCESGNIRGGDYYDYDNDKWLKVTEVSPEELKKQQQANYELTPHYAATSKGFDFKKIQTEFKCPDYNKDPKGNVKCNQDIKKALESGWTPGKPIPDEFKQSKSTIGVNNSTSNGGNTFSFDLEL